MKKRTTIILRKTIRHILPLFGSLCVLCPLAGETLKRPESDPFIKIESGQSLLPPSDPAFQSTGEHPRITEKTGIETYKKLWGKRYVIMLHPYSEKKAAVIDFSKITKSKEGRLRLYIHPHPDGDHRVVIFKENKPVEKVTLREAEWEYFGIEFNNEPIRLEIHANNWHYEHSFVSYHIEER